MEYIAHTLDNLVHQTAFLNLTWGNYLMIAVACVFLYLAIAKDFEPLLLVGIAFGMLLVNIYPDIIKAPTETATGGLLYYFYILDEWAILPSLIFMGVGAMTDFGPLIANPKSFLLGAAAQFGIFTAYFGAIAMGFNGKAAAAISIIGGADGPSDIFDGTDCRSGVFLHVSGSDYSASDYEAVYIGEGQEDQDGAAPPGFQARENSVPDCCYDRCLHDSSYDSTSYRYADAW